MARIKKILLVGLVLGGMAIGGIQFHERDVERKVQTAVESARIECEATVSRSHAKGLKVGQILCDLENLPYDLSTQPRIIDLLTLENDSGIERLEQYIEGVEKTVSTGEFRVSVWVDVSLVTAFVDQVLAGGVTWKYPKGGARLAEERLRRTRQRLRNLKESVSAAGGPSCSGLKDLSLSPRCLWWIAWLGDLCRREAEGLEPTQVVLLKDVASSSTDLEAIVVEFPLPKTCSEGVRFVYDACRVEIEELLGEKDSCGLRDLLPSLAPDVLSGR